MQQTTLKDFLRSKPYESKYKIIKHDFFEIKEYDNGMIMVTDIENQKYKFYKRKAIFKQLANS